MCNHTQEQLNEVWENINNGKYGNDPSIVKPERVSSDEHSDIMSIPVEGGTDRTMYERKKGESWEIVPPLPGNL